MLWTIRTTTTRMWRSAELASLCRRTSAMLPKPEKEYGNPRGHSQFRRFRQGVLAENPLCARCAELGKTVAGEHLRRVREGALGGDLMDEQNAQVLCRACHERHHRDARLSGRRIKISVDGDVAPRHVRGGRAERLEEVDAPISGKQGYSAPLRSPGPIRASGHWPHRCPATSEAVETRRSVAVETALSGASLLHPMARASRARAPAPPARRRARHGFESRSRAFFRPNPVSASRQSRQPTRNPSSPRNPAAQGKQALGLGEARGNREGPRQD